jgi:hypothetical protein
MTFPIKPLYSNYYTRFHRLNQEKMQLKGALEHSIINQSIILITYLMSQVVSAFVFTCTSLPTQSSPSSPSTSPAPSTSSTLATSESTSAVAPCSTPGLSPACTSCFPSSPRYATANSVPSGAGHAADRSSARYSSTFALR